MSDEPKILRIAVALAGDVPEARGDLIEVVRDLNRLAEEEGREGRVEITAWCEEGDQPDFYSESPRTLIERIRVTHNPDIIIGVFWTRFGTAERDPASDASQVLKHAEEEHRLAEEAWSKSDHPRVMLYLCDRKLPAARDAEERARQTYVTLLRGSFTPGTFWWPYKKRSEFRNTPHEQELRKVVFGHLLKFVRRWKADGPALRADTIPLPELDLPEGWEILDPHKLSQWRGTLDAGRRLPKADAINYFNGTGPSWKIAVSESVPRRQAVGTLVEKISEAAYSERLRVTLLVGPGGEGKSTILRQVAVDLAEGCPDVYVIWRNSKEAPLTERWLRQLPKKQGSFVIASDNAARIAQDVYEIMLSFREDTRLNIQFLLASQSIEWMWARAPEDYKWRRYLGDDFARVQVSKLDMDDADKVVAAWEQAGSEGLGSLAAYPKDERAKILASMAHDEAINNPMEGSFLGAMLKARKSVGVQTRSSREADDDPFEGYIREILDRLQERDAPGGKKLREAFAYIAAMHADWDREGWPIPSKPILARVLSCSVDELEDAVIKPLADEAMTSSSPEWLVLTRHRAIAQTAKRILNINAKFERQIYPELLKSARETYLAKEVDRYEIGPWNNLPRLYFERNQLDLALRLAEVLADVEPHDPFPVVSWAHIHRDAKQKPEAASTFRERFELVQPDKGYFYEWSVSEGQTGNHCFSTWLAAIALSDRVGERQRRTGNVPSMARLSGLTTSLGELFAKASNPNNAAFHDPAHAQTFLKACVAAASLGLDERSLEDSERDSKYVDKARRNLDRGESLRKVHKLPAPEPGEAFIYLQEGIKLACELRGKDSGKLPDSVPDFADLRFSRLKSLFGVRDEPGARNISLIKTPTPRDF